MQCGKGSSRLFFLRHGSILLIRLFLLPRAVLLQFLFGIVTVIRRIFLVLLIRSVLLICFVFVFFFLCLIRFRFLRVILLWRFRKICGNGMISSDICEIKGGRLSYLDSIHIHRANRITLIRRNRIHNA